MLFTIFLSVIFNQDDMVQLTATKELFSFDEYNEHVLEQPKQVHFVEGTMYIADAGQKLWQVNTNNYEVTLLANQGEGPGELIRSIYNLYSWDDKILLIDQSGFRINYFSKQEFLSSEKILPHRHFFNGLDWYLTIRYESRHKSSSMVEDQQKNVIYAYITDGKQREMLLSNPEDDFVPFFECRLNIFQKWALFFGEVGRKQKIHYMLWDLETHSIVDKGERPVSDLSFVAENNKSGVFDYTFGCTNNEHLGFVLTERRRRINRTDCYIKVFDPNIKKWGQLRMDFSKLGSMYFPSFFCYLNDNKWAVFNEGKLIIFETNKSHEELLRELSIK